MVIWRSVYTPITRGQWEQLKYANVPKNLNFKQISIAFQNLLPPDYPTAYGITGIDFRMYEGSCREPKELLKRITIYEHKCSYTVLVHANRNIHGTMSISHFIELGPITTLKQKLLTELCVCVKKHFGVHAEHCEY